MKMNKSDIYLGIHKFHHLKEHFKNYGGIELFPNESIFKVHKEGIETTYHLACEILVTYMTPKERGWFLERDIYKVPIVQASAEDGFFPKSLVAGVIKNRYSMETQLSKLTGWIGSTGNMCTATEAFKEKEFKKYTQPLLEKNNFTVIWKV